MFPPSSNTSLVKNTSYKVVLPFYIYAALSILVATILLFFSSSAFLQHYFHPKTLAITHIMALGWGTMIILGASHQLVPVLIEGRLHSNVLAYFLLYWQHWEFPCWCMDFIILILDGLHNGALS